jgi:hypothetical protein
MPATKSTIAFALAVTGCLMLTATAGMAFGPPGGGGHGRPLGPICDASCQANKARPIPRPTATNGSPGATPGGMQRPDRNRRLN